jgi:hypothetical protein
MSSPFLHVVLKLINIILARYVLIHVETDISWCSSCLLCHPIRTYYTGLQCIREAVHHTQTFGSQRTEHVRNKIIKRPLSFHIRNNSELVGWDILNIRSFEVSKVLVVRISVSLFLVKFVWTENTYWSQSLCSSRKYK